MQCPGNPVGTLVFAAPETFQQGVHTDMKKVDVYAFSIILWQLKEIKAPYQDENQRPPDVIWANVIAGVRPILSEDDSPHGLIDLITQCWDSNPDVRPSFEESLRKLEGVLGSTSIEQSVAVTAGSQEAVKGVLTTATKECSEENVSLPLKLQFYNVFIGNDKPHDDNQNGSFFSVQLEELSSAKVIQLYQKCEGKEFMKGLQPYLVDLLKRRQDLQTVIDMFINALNEEEMSEVRPQKIRLPELLLELMVKDIFISLIEVTPHSAHSRLVSLYASLHRAIPLVYILQTSLEQTKTVSNFHALQDLLAIPSYPLVVSCGTEKATGRGKSSLMAELVKLFQHSSLSSNSFDTKTGPTHLPSIDLALEVKADVETGLNIADVHGFTMETEFCHALSTLCSVAALVLVHITKDDLYGDCSPTEGLRSLLFRCCSLHHCDARVVFFIRDVNSITPDSSDSLLVSSRNSLSKLFPPNKVFDVIGVVNLHDCRTDSHRQQAVVRIRDRIRPLMSRLTSKLPCFEVLNEHHEHHRSTLLSSQKSFKRQLGDMKDGFSELGRKVYEVLDKSMPHDNRLYDSIFPLTAVYAAVARIRQRERQLLEQDVQSQDVLSELDKLAVEVRDLENRKLACQISEAVKLFVTVVKKGKCNEIGQFHRYVEYWKSRYVIPRLDKRKNLLHQFQLIDKASEQESSIRHELEILADQIDQLDISVDSFWNELMELCALQEDDTVDRRIVQRNCDLDTASVKRVYTRCIIEGYPMQLLRSHPLQMTAAKLLKDIFRELDSRGKGKVPVVSIIGPQSSAKSTLLNYLFGSEFATRAGRCTKGIFASYVHVSNGQRLLVWDFEGLLSLEGGGRIFDGQLTVMALACSDIVIVNDKGGISSQIKRLLEVCLYAMDYLKVASRQPEMFFVLRDQTDRYNHLQDNALALIKKQLNNAISSYQMDFHSLISLRQGALFLLPNAFSEQQHEGRAVEGPSLDFSKKSFLVRSQILQWTRQDECTIHTSAAEDCSLVGWYRDVCTVWDTLTRFGHTLLHYETLNERHLHEQMSCLVKDIVRELVESEKGLNGKAKEVIFKYTSSLQAEREERCFVNCDAECKRKLACLRDTFLEKIYQEFDEKVDSEKYSDDLKKRFRLKLTTSVIHSYNAHVCTWHMQFKVASDCLHKKMIDRHFEGRTVELLKSRVYQCAISEAKAVEMFEDRWSELERIFSHQFQETKQTPEDIQQEVWGVFRAVASRHKHDNEILAVITQRQPNREDCSRPWFVESDNVLWFDQYMDIKHANIFLGAHEAFPRTPPPICAEDVIRDVVPEVKKTVQTFLDAVCRDLSQNDKLDSTAIADIVVRASDLAAYIERYLRNHNTRLKLHRAPFVNDLYVYLQQTASQFVCSAAEKRVKDEAMKLMKIKEEKRKKFLDIMLADIK